MQAQYADLQVLRDERRCIRKRPTASVALCTGVNRTLWPPRAKVCK